MRTASWAISALILGASLLGCEKSSETQKQESDKATSEADKKQTQATTEADKNAREAREKADRERDDLHATVIREKVEYRAKLHEALDRMDKDLADQKVDVKNVKRGDRSQDAKLFGGRPAKDYSSIEAILVRRDRLMDLTDEIDKAIDHDWPSLKERVDLELKDRAKPLKPGRT